MITLDKAIEEEIELYEISKDKYEKLGINHCKVFAEEHEQYAGWLEELKEYRAIGTVEECRSSVLDIIKAYNKGIDDFANSLLSNDVIDKSVVRRTCIQLKKGEEII